MVGVVLALAAFASAGPAARLPPGGKASAARLAAPSVSVRSALASSLPSAAPAALAAAPSLAANASALPRALSAAASPRALAAFVSGAPILAAGQDKKAVDALFAERSSGEPGLVAGNWASRAQDGRLVVRHQEIPGAPRREYWGKIEDAPVPARGGARAAAALGAAAGLLAALTAAPAGIMAGPLSMLLAALALAPLGMALASFPFRKPHGAPARIAAILGGATAACLGLLAVNAVASPWLLAALLVPSGALSGLAAQGALLAPVSRRSLLVVLGAAALLVGGLFLPGTALAAAAPAPAAQLEALKAFAAGVGSIGAFAGLWNAVRKRQNPFTVPTTWGLVGSLLGVILGAIALNAASPATLGLGSALGMFALMFLSRAFAPGRPLLPAMILGFALGGTLALLF